MGRGENLRKKSLNDPDTRYLIDFLPPPFESREVLIGEKQIFVLWWASGQVVFIVSVQTV